MAMMGMMAHSQSVEEQKKAINTIKKSSAYIYAEATLENEQDAYDLAQELLYQRVNEYIATKKKFKNAKEAVVINQNYAKEKIQLPRGNMYRAFLYVKKDDVIPSENAVVGRIEKKGERSSSIEVIEDNIVQELLAFNTLADLKRELPIMKREGKVISYAKYSELAAPNKFILVIYDKQGQIRAVLSEGEKRINLKTNAPDNINNYKGMGAVGVKIKK